MIFSFPANFIIILKKACISFILFNRKIIQTSLFQFKNPFSFKFFVSESLKLLIIHACIFPIQFLPITFLLSKTIIPQTITSSQFKLIIFKTTGIGDTSNERSQFANKIKRCSSIAPTCKLGIISNSIAENSKVMSPASLRTKLGESSRIPKQVKYPQRNFQRSVQLNDDAPSDETLYS